MSQILLLKCSPKKNGVTDLLAEHFRSGLANFPHTVTALRDWRIIPCQNCGACVPAPHICPLDALDDCAEIYNRLFASRLAVFASPIYFYALPAHFKAFIDRCQRFWVDKSTRRPQFGALALLACGRPRGEKLFEGALRTLTWFLKPLNGRLCDQRCFRGLDSPGDVSSSPGLEAEVRAWAREWREKKDFT